MKDTYGPRPPGSLAGHHNVRVDFGVPDVKEDDGVALVPQDLQPLPDNLGVEHIAMADDMICPQVVSSVRDKKRRVGWITVLKSRMRTPAFVKAAARIRPSAA